MIAMPLMIAGDSSIGLSSLLIGLLGGLAVFLLGMEIMTDALKLLAGDSMKRVIGKLATNRWRAAFTGAFVTAVIQSSSVTTVLVVGFVSAGLLSLAQSIGIIMGANVGTTITAQIIAIKATQHALLIVALGFLLRFLTRRPAFVRGGRCILGLGLIFLGMNLMTETSLPLRSYGPFIDLLGHLRNPLIGMTAAALFTAIIQASAATTGIVIVLAAQGLVPLETGIALILGANIGTCVTAWLAAIGSVAEAKRAALAHILFNIAGALIWLPVIPLFARVVAFISPRHEELEGIARIAAEAPRQIANAHGVFNLMNLALFIGFTGPLARLLEKLVKADTRPASVQPRFLDPLLLATPALALPRVRLELAHLARVVREFAAMFPGAVARGADAVRELAERDDDIDRLHEAVIGYLARLNVKELKQREIDLIACYTSTANYLEQIGDTLATNGISVASSLARHRKDLARSEPSESSRMLAQVVDESMSAIIRLLDEDDLEAGRDVVRRKNEVIELMRRSADDLMLRLRMGGESAVPLYRAESDLLDLQRRVFYLERRIAKTMLASIRIAADEPNQKALT